MYTQFFTVIVVLCCTLQLKRILLFGDKFSRATFSYYFFSLNTYDISNLSLNTYQSLDIREQNKEQCLS